LEKGYEGSLDLTRTKHEHCSRDKGSSCDINDLANGADSLPARLAAAAFAPRGRRRRDAAALHALK
jgi:hypothetical protein